MPTCSACNTEMVIHEEGVFQNVWKCPSNSMHPTQTKKSGFAWGVTAVGTAGALVVGGPVAAAAVIHAIFSGAPDA